MQKLKQLLIDLEPAIADIINQPGSPRSVYEPISYILSLGGKRIRPAMVLAAYKLYKKEYSPEVMQVAQAVEMFHNFTLLHDDIMDHSPCAEDKKRYISNGIMQRPFYPVICYRLKSTKS